MLIRVNAPRSPYVSIPDYVQISRILALLTAMSLKEDK